MNDFNPMSILAFVITALGIFILVRFFTHIRRASSRKNWTQTTGEIIGSELKEAVRLGAEGPTIDYLADIRYKYKVNLVEYEGSVISASEPPFSIGFRGYAQGQVDRYPLNRKVPVYFNPDQPEEAVLETGRSTSGLLLLGILGFLTLSCGLCLLYGFFIYQP